MSGEPERLREKKRQGIFTDRAGILHDLALVLCNESLFPVARMQTMISELHSRVRRKLIVLDCRATPPAPPSAPPSAPPRSLHSPVLFSRSVSRTSETGGLDWDLPKVESCSFLVLCSCKIYFRIFLLIKYFLQIPEEATEKLISMFVIRPLLTDPTIIPKAVDSHPRRMNGFLTGCLIQVNISY